MHPGTSAHAARPTLTAVAVIPARYGSTRLPGKPLLEIAGRPLVEHVYRRARMAPSLTAVIVATDDGRIAEAVESFGGEVRLTDPAHPTGTDRLAEVAADLDCDVVVNVQGDEPLIEPAMIEQVIGAIADDPEAPMATLRRRIDESAVWLDPNVVKVVTDRRDRALYFSRAPIPWSQPGDVPGPHALGFKHIGLYAYRRDFLAVYARLEPSELERRERLEQLRALAHGYAITAPETSYDSVGVDTRHDLERVRQAAMAEVRATGDS